MASKRVDETKGLSSFTRCSFRVSYNQLCMFKDNHLKALERQLKQNEDSLHGQEDKGSGKRWPGHSIRPKHQSGDVSLV